MAAHADQMEPKSAPESQPVGKDDLQTLPLAEVEKKLGSSPDGLTQVEAQNRLAQFGPNEIPEKKTNELLKFLSYFWGPIPWMIEAAVILSAAAQHWPEIAPQRSRATKSRVAREFPAHAGIQNLADRYDLTFGAQAAKGWPYGAPRASKPQKP